jgi:succinate dehydrogenase/fumarate reductase flavoprotein subunit/uncharacterized protein with FMN-binding domain
MKRWLSLLLVFCLLLVGCTAQKTTADPEPAPVVTPAPAKAIYTPGTYEASANGFGGAVSVKVTVDASAITAVEIAGANETPGIGQEAMGVLKDAILSKQTADVDAVTGATMTSNAVKQAANAALAAARGEVQQSSALKDGTYTASAPSYKKSGGMLDTVTLELTVKNNAVSAVKVKEYGDTPAIGGMAFDLLCEQLVEYQSLGIDAVTGATVSTAGFLAAAADAIVQAGGDPLEWQNRKVEKRAPVTSEMETQIVVIGAGIAGLSAAVEAANLGAKVILVEKQAVLGSSTTRSEGYVQAANTDLQKAHGVQDSVESLYEDIYSLYKNEEKFEPHLLKVATDGSTDLIRFLLDAGVKFDHLEAISKNPPRNVPRNHCVEGGGGGITSNLYKTAVEKGVTVLMGTPCTELIMDGNAVVGIKATNDFGDDITIRAGSVILCAGSYTNNLELFKELNPKLKPEAISGSGDGDAYYLSLQANADIVKLDYVQMMYYFFSTKMTGWPSVIPGAPQTSVITPVSNVIFLDGGGKRVANEDEFCFDYVEKNWQGGYDEGWTLVGAAFAEQYPDVIQIALTSELGSREGKLGYTANTIEELCAQTGLDAKTVQATLDRYNELCDKGVDEDFHKPAEYMERVEAPYYLLRMPMVCTDGYTGARINENAQVIDVNGNVIPGFYAAGSCAVAQMSSVRYYGCGSSLLFGGVYGRVAAAHAVNNP